MGRLILPAVVAVALGSAGTARAQLREPYDDGCPAARWQDAISGQDSSLNLCRREFVRRYASQLVAPTAPNGLAEVVIDPIAITTRRGAHGTLARKPQRVRVINLNPYLYSYSITLKQAPVVETAPLDFFKALIPSMPALTDPKSPLHNALALHGSKCRRHDPNLAALADEARRLESRYATTYSDVRTLDDLKDAIRREEGIVTSQQSDAPEVQRAALRAIADLTDYIHGIDPTVAEIAAFHAALGAHLARVPAALAGGSCDADELIALDESLTEHDAALAKVAAELTKPSPDGPPAQALDKERTGLGLALLDKTNFYWIRDIQADQSQIDSITVARRPASIAKDAKDPAFTTVMVATTRIGLPRLFTIGGGIAYVPTLYRSFAVTKRYTGSAVAGDTVHSVISEQASDTRRVSPMLTLGAMFPIDQFWRQTLVSGIGAQLGTTVNKDASTSLEYFAGGALSLLDSRVFVSYGGYAAKETSLADNLAVGDRVPLAQTTVPTTTHTRWRSAWMFGFRFY